MHKSEETYSFQSRGNMNEYNNVVYPKRMIEENTLSDSGDVYP